VLNRLNVFGPVWRWVLAEGVREVAGFGEFIATELHGFGPQFVCACLALEKAANLPATGRLSLMERMMHEKRGQLLGRLSDGEVWSEAGLKALAKLNTTACRRSDYLKLAGYNRQPTTARVLAFAPYLSPRILGAIWKLPDWICLPNLLPIFEQREAVAAIKKTFKGRLWDLSSDLRLSVTRSLHGVTSSAQLFSKLLTWRERLLFKEPFPLPPIPGNEFLIPLRSAAEMRREAREMRNCLHKMIEEVFAGHVYFYSWKGAERASVLVIDDGTRLAHLEIKGRSNALVQQETISQVRALVAEQFSKSAER
jgi:hypothetical protein